MAESVLGVVSQSSLLFLDSSKCGFRTWATPFTVLGLQRSTTGKRSCWSFAASSGKYLKPVFVARVGSLDFEASTLVSGEFDFSSEGSGGGGGGGDSGDRKNEGEGESSDDSSGVKKKMALFLPFTKHFYLFERRRDSAH